MANVKRVKSEAGIYHITNRGIGRQIIFEDDHDRQYLISRLHSRAENLGTAILAWCLMDNHIHLLLKDELEAISQLMLEVNSAYSHYFNKRHNRIGSLFQGRFGSTPINTERQLIATVRYIHRNPVEAFGGDYTTYAWSSYQEYLEDPKLTSVDFFLEIIGSKENFSSMHANEYDEPVPFEQAQIKMRTKENDVLAIAQSELKEISPYEIKSLPKPQRNALLCRLLGAGLSIRQIERLTGIGRSIISRAANM